VAPNTLTILGFANNLIPFLIMIWLGPGVLPSWFVFLEAFCYFVYRLLDEMDGKQARRTGNSSGLGLLFDHGCDCFAMGL
jgi:ethanolaminephosphotransferase